MTAPVSRERIAQIREMHRPRGVTPGDFLAVPDTRADIADLLAAAEWGWDEHDRAERLAEEVARWESGRRVKVLPVLPEQPDALHLAAELVRKQTGEYEDTDAAMRAGAAALRDVDQTARAARADLAALVADLRALCDEVQATESMVLRTSWSTAHQVRALLDRHAARIAETAPEEKP